jgi:hypothetical protein
MSYPVITTALLRTLAGETRFQQGLHALQAHQVRRFHYENRIASAEVQEFSPKVRYVGDRVEGSCNCPDSEGFEFCQHCTSVVLFANELVRQRRSLYKGPDKSKVMAYLLSLDQKELARQCLELIANDPALMKRYLLRISLGGDEVDFRKLRSQITELTRHEGTLFSQRQVQHYFARIERFLEELSSADYLAQPEAMTRIVEYAIRRINLVLGRIRSRHVGHETSARLLRHLYRHLLAVPTQRPSTRASQLLKIWLDDHHRLLEPMQELFDEDPELAHHLRQKMLAAWQGKAAQSEPWQRAKLAEALLAQAPEDVPFDQLQAWRSVLATGPEDWLRIAEFWQAQGQVEQAQQVLLVQLQQHPQHTSLQNALTQLCQRHDLGLESVFDLFKAHPLPILPLLRTLSDTLPTDQRFLLWQRCVEFLQTPLQPAHHTMLMQLLLELGDLQPDLAQQWYAQAFTLALQHAVQPELNIELALRTCLTDTEASLDLFCATLQRLLEAERRRLDEVAAEALHRLEQRLPASAMLALEDRFDRLRPLVQRRPSFIQRYRTLQEGRVHTPLGEQS